MNWILSKTQYLGRKKERRSYILSESNIRTCLKYKAPASDMEMHARGLLRLIVTRSIDGNVQASGELQKHTFQNQCYECELIDSSSNMMQQREPIG